MANYQSTQTGLQIDAASIGRAAADNHFINLCSSIDPDCLLYDGATFSRVVAANATLLLLASWSTRIGAAGRLEVRDPSRGFLPLRGTTLTGTNPASGAVYADPTIVTYADAYSTYFNRLYALTQQKTKTIDLSSTTAATYKLFLPGPYGSIFTSVTCYDVAWMTCYILGTYGINLMNETGDDATSSQRVGNALCFPITKATCDMIGLGTAKTATTGLGTITWVDLPSTWSTLTDANTYIFRNDFLSSISNMTASAGMALDANFSWLAGTGTQSWGARGAFSTASTPRVDGKQFVCDVAIADPKAANASIAVGWHDGAGHSFADMAHCLNFGSTGITVYENGTSRGLVGSGWEDGRIYRVRITLNDAGAVYEIQGGAYGAVGGASWTTLSPSSTTSATNTLHAGCAIYDGVWYVGDMKLIAP